MTQFPVAQKRVYNFMPAKAVQASVTTAAPAAQAAQAAQAALAAALPAHS